MSATGDRARVTPSGRDAGQAAPRFAVQRKCACGNRAAAATGECAACRDRRFGVQRKLVVGPAADASEREADAIARDAANVVPDAVPGFSRASDAGFSRARGVGAGFSRPVDPIRISRAPVPAAVQHDATGGGLDAPATVHDVLAESGQPLGTRSRGFFEARFGQDFSRVRIHTDGAAARSAADIGSRAYTAGRHIVFGQGQYAPDTASGRSLLAHELTHVVQQGAGGDVVQRDLIFGSGYPNPFKGNPAAEAAAAQKTPREWFPSSVDFQETAALSGGGTGISTLSGVLAEIGKKSPGSLTDLDLMGHANGDLFALGGTITTTSVSGSKGGTIGPNQLAAAQPEIDKVRDRFSPNGRITIYGCNSGASGALLTALSTAFRVCARGFKDEITWCLGWQTNPVKIDSRGRTLILPKDGTPCDQYEGSIYNHTPDTSDCSGTKPKAPDVKLPDRKPSAPEVSE